MGGQRWLPTCGTVSRGPLWVAVGRVAPLGRRVGPPLGVARAPGRGAAARVAGGRVAGPWVARVARGPPGAIARVARGPGAGGWGQGLGEGR